MQEQEKIIEEIDGKIEELRENPSLEDVDICYGLNQAKDIICKHMNDGWIPVEEQLPNHNLDVEVTGRDGDRAVAHYSKENKMWVDTIYDRIIDVIAWKEPSEPYRPERREENEHKAEKETIQKTVWT